MHLPPTIDLAIVQTQVWLGAASVLRSTQAAKWVQSPFDRQGPVKTKKFFARKRVK